MQCRPPLLPAGFVSVLTGMTVVTADSLLTLMPCCTYKALNIRLFSQCCVDFRTSQNQDYETLSYIMVILIYFIKQGRLCSKHIKPNSEGINLSLLLIERHSQGTFSTSCEN